MGCCLDRDGILCSQYKSNQKAARIEFSTCHLLTEISDNLIILVKAHAALMASRTPCQHTFKSGPGFFDFTRDYEQYLMCLGL